jgi:membrane-associated phospholipid phosphatase
MYDAINSIERTHEPYFMFEDASPDASQEAAVAMAAYHTLAALYDDRDLVALFSTTLMDQLDVIPDGPEKAEGMAIGLACANGTLGLRADDGSDNDAPYVPGSNYGDWVPTAPDFSGPASPNWPLVTPWTMISADQFRPLGPAGYTSMTALLRSREYAAVYNDVKKLGSVGSRHRTPEQTLIARFWANDRDGTYKPPGHLNVITQVVAAQQGNTLFENARLFALLNLALADAGIVAWDAKYSTSIDLWRPITGIRQGAHDHNPRTVPSPHWTPLSHDPAVNGFTPPFPAWVSGHATFAATHAAVLREFYGTDNITFTVGSDDTPDVERNYASLTQAALENGRSRVYLGVHWQFDADDGFAAGSALGEFVVDNYLRLAGDADASNSVDVADVELVLRSWGPCETNVCRRPGDLTRDGNVDTRDLMEVLAHWQ